MEVEGGDGIKGLTRLGWHTLLRHAVQPGLSVHPVRRHVCVCTCTRLCETENTKDTQLCATIAEIHSAAGPGTAIQ